MSREAIAEYTAYCESNPKKVPIAEVHLFSDEDVTTQFPQVQTYCEKCYEFAQKELVYYRMSATSITVFVQLRLKKAEFALFRKQRFWYMVQAGMGWEAVKQCKHWIKIARQKE